MQFPLRDPEPLLYHNEPIWRDGAIVGRITSGSTATRSVGAVGWVILMPRESTSGFMAQGHWEIEVAGRRVAATASLAPLYDPKSERIRT